MPQRRFAVCLTEDHYHFALTSQRCEMLQNKVIIYDDSCPMCKLYTYWFVAWGFLKPENRIGFATAPREITSHVDLDRGRHEIPLYDRATKETLYGLNALTFILGSRWTWLKPLFRSQPFFWAFYPLYQIITYNRRVIAGCRACCGFDCAPDLNRFYRSVYLVLASCVIGLIAGLLATNGSIFATAGLGLIMAFASVGLFVGSIVRISGGSLAAWNHAGNYVTSLLITSATLLPLLVWPNLANGLEFGVVGAAALLGLEEIRRREL